METIEKDHPSGSREPGLHWVKKLAIGLGILFGLFVLRTAIGLGSAFVHYRLTQDFESFIAEQAVSDEALEAWLPKGELLASDREWTFGRATLEDPVELVLNETFTIKHGEDLLLEAVINIRATATKDTWAEERYSISASKLHTVEGMRAVVQVGVRNKADLIQEVDGRRGVLFADVVLVAGDGPDEFRVVELMETPPKFEEWLSDISPLRALLGLVHPSGALPEEGWMHQVRSQVTMSWHKTSHGSGSVSFSPAAIRMNCDGYSFETEWGLEQLRDGHSGLQTKSSWSSRYTWNEDVW